MVGGDHDNCVGQGSTPVQLGRAAFPGPDRADASRGCRRSPRDFCGPKSQAAGLRIIWGVGIEVVEEGKEGPFGIAIRPCEESIGNFRSPAPGGLSVGIEQPEIESLGTKRIDQLAGHGVEQTLPPGPAACHRNGRSRGPRPDLSGGIEPVRHESTRPITHGLKSFRQSRPSGHPTR